MIASRCKDRVPEELRRAHQGGTRRGKKSSRVPVGAAALYAGRMSSPVSWDVAERVGVWVSSGKPQGDGRLSANRLGPADHSGTSSPTSHVSPSRPRIWWFVPRDLHPPQVPPRHGRRPGRLGARQHPVVPPAARPAARQARADPDASHLVICLRTVTGKPARIRHRMDVDPGPRPVRHPLHRGHSLRTSGAGGDQSVRRTEPAGTSSLMSARTSSASREVTASLPSSSVCGSPCTR